MSLRFSTAALLLIGCGDKDDSGGSADAPDIEVSMASIDFGEVDTVEGASESILIENTGGYDLSISSVYLVFGETAFTVQALTTQTVPPGGSVGLTVDFLPTDPAVVTDTLVIASDDPDEGLVEIALSGSGTWAGLSTQDGVDFGAVQYGCSTSLSLSIDNDGSERVIVESASVSGSAFSVSTEALPLSMEAGESTTATLTYTPADIAADSGTLTLTSDIGEVTVSLQGEGVSAGTVSELFTGSNAPVDLLFFADQSCSMDDNNTLLGSSFSTFADTMDAMGLDWQVAAITEDSGCNNALITPDTKDAGWMFERAITQGSGGVYTEALLTMLNNALGASGSGECNEGMVRSGAEVHAVMLTDEPEQSSVSWSTNVSQAVKLAGSLGATGLIIDAVAGDYPSGCAGYVDGRYVTADAGVGYHDAVSYTGGSYYSICGDYDVHFADLAGTLGDSSAFILEQTPIEQSITVTVDGASVTGWSYSADSNTVTLDEPPASDEAVEITYEVLGECE